MVPPLDIRIEMEEKNKKSKAEHDKRQAFSTQKALTTLTFMAEIFFCIRDMAFIRILIPHPLLFLPPFFCLPVRSCTVRVGSVFFYFFY